MATALLDHPAVAESGVICRADELRGEVISAFLAAVKWMQWRDTGTFSAQFRSVSMHSPSFDTSDKFLERSQTVTEQQKKLIRRIRSIWFDSSYNHNSQQFVAEMGSLVTALYESADHCGALEITKIEWKGVTYTKPEHVQFVNDMIAAGERDNLMCYHGSPMYYGPGVSVPNAQDALGATQVRCHWDNLGLGFIVHPCVSDQALSEAYDTEA